MKGVMGVARWNGCVSIKLGNIRSKAPQLGAYTAEFIDSFKDAWSASETNGMSWLLGCDSSEREELEPMLKAGEIKEFAEDEFSCAETGDYVQTFLVGLAGEIPQISIKGTVGVSDMRGGMDDYKLRFESKANSNVITIWADFDDEGAYYSWRDFGTSIFEGDEFSDRGWSGRFGKAERIFHVSVNGEEPGD